MAKSAVVTLNVSTYGDGTNESYSIPVLTNTASPGMDDPHTFTAGFNSLAVPTGAKCLIITDSTADLTLKGVTGDTGYVLPLGFPAEIPIKSGVATIGITAVGTPTANLKWR